MLVTNIFFFIHVVFEWLFSQSWDHLVKTYTEPKKKFPPVFKCSCSVNKKLKMSNDLHIFGQLITCQIKQILTRMKAFCRRNLLRAISTCMHRPVEFLYIFSTFQSEFIDFYVSKKKTLKKTTFFFSCLCF